MYKLLSIFVLVVVIAYFFMPQYEGLDDTQGGVCKSCDDLSFGQCLKCFDCGFCGNGSTGKCMKQNSTFDGPANKEKCSRWYNNDPFWRYNNSNPSENCATTPFVPELPRL